MELKENWITAFRSTKFYGWSGASDHIQEWTVDTVNIAPDIYVFILAPGNVSILDLNRDTSADIWVGARREGKKINHYRSSKLFTHIYIATTHHNSSHIKNQDTDVLSRAVALLLGLDPGELTLAIAQTLIK